MEPILKQLGLDSTFFIQFVLVAALYLVLARLYFRPFQRLIERRLARTIEDRRAAEEMLLQAQEKMVEYQRRLGEERKLARAEIDHALLEAKKVEAAHLRSAREAAKTITQEVSERLRQERARVEAELRRDVDGLADAVVERMLGK